MSIMIPTTTILLLLKIILNHELTGGRPSSFPVIRFLPPCTDKILETAAVSAATREEEQAVSTVAWGNLGWPVFERF